MNVYPYSPFVVSAYEGARPLLRSDEWVRGGELWNLLYLSFDLEQPFTQHWTQEKCDAFLRLVKKDLRRRSGRLAALMHLPAEEAVQKILSDPEDVRQHELYKMTNGCWVNNLLQAEAWVQKHPLQFDNDPEGEDFYQKDIDDTLKEYEALMRRVRQKELK